MPRSEIKLSWYSRNQQKRDSKVEDRCARLQWTSDCGQTSVGVQGPPSRPLDLHLGWQPCWKGVLSFSLTDIGDQGGRSGCQPTCIGFWEAVILQEWWSYVSWAEVRASWAAEGVDSLERRQRSERRPCLEILAVSMPLYAFLFKRNKYPHSFCLSNTLVF